MKMQRQLPESQADVPDDDPAGPAAGPRVSVRLLGGFSLELDGRSLCSPQSVRRVVAFLGVHAYASRASIASTLWSDVPEEKAYASLRTALWRLRRLSPQPVVTGREMLSLAGSVDIDVRTLVATAQQVLQSDQAEWDRSAVPRLAAVGELLPGWYDDWVLFERDRLRQLQLHALEVIAERRTAQQRYAEAIEAALAAVRLEPLRESATRALIAAHLAEHNVIEAVRRFESLRSGLTTELGVQPTPELLNLIESRLNRSA
jgi:DNA-binding SARP family transcriptional activator